MRNYTRIGYFCENIIIYPYIYEYTFEVMPKTRINYPKYKRIQWQKLNPKGLIENESFSAVEIFDQKKYFSSFLYYHKLPNREEFFKQLSKYEKVDAPGKSMNNLGSIDNKYKGDIWERKKQILIPYKFTFTFENYVFIGYQSEKLHYAMKANSNPIYCGDSLIFNIFNMASFVNTPDYVKTNYSRPISCLEKNSKLDFIDILPQYYNTPNYSVKRKPKAIGR